MALFFIDVGRDEEFGGMGRIEKDLGGFGWNWEGIGRLREESGGNGKIWEDLGGFGKIREDSGGFGRIGTDWEGFGRDLERFGRVQETFELQITQNGAGILFLFILCGGLMDYRRS